MTVIDDLSALVKSELADEAAALEALDAADRADPVPPVDEVRAALPEKGVSVALHRLLARALRGEDEEDEADQVDLQLVERLNQAGYWKAMVRLAAPLLEDHEHQVAPLLLRARLQGGVEAVDDELLDLAHGFLPRHGVLAWTVAQARAAAGDADRARKAAESALPELLEDKNHEAAEEAALFLAETEDPHIAPVFLHALAILARQEAWSVFDGMLELSSERLAHESFADAAWPVIRDLWLRHPDPEGLRPRVVEIARGALAHYPDADALVRSARINIPSEEPKECLERLRRAMAFPPGYYALHSGWGLGPIRDNDTEAVIIDFPAKPIHRMTFATAERALEALAPHDPRVLKAFRPDELKRVLKEEPATVLAQTLQRVKGHEATGDQIRKLLVPEIVAPGSWASWWKAAKTAAAGDERIDTRRAYDNLFRLREPGEALEEFEIPGWAPRQAVLKNLALLDTFLDQHPEGAEAVREEHGSRVEDIVCDDRRPGHERLAAAAWLGRVGAPSPSSLAELVDADLDVNKVPRPVQEELVDVVTGADALGALLDSRLQAVRRGVWKRLTADPALLDAVLPRLFADATEHPEAVLHVLEKGFDALAARGSDEWTRRVILAVLDLVETPPKETHRKRTNALLTDDGEVASLLRAHPVPEDESGTFTSRLKQWRASDRYRFPLLDYLREAGHGHVSDEVEGHRARSAARIQVGVTVHDDPYDGDTVLTRPTLNRLEGERTRIGMELKTTIPQAINKARELGDLKENAEYHAAKEKQANFAKRFEELTALLDGVRLVENLDRPVDVALPGTEVRLEPVGGGQPQILWLLGEGDQDLGEEVVSYKAPLGKAVHGNKVGDEVALPDGSTVRIAEVRERLP